MSLDRKAAQARCEAASNGPWMGPRVTDNWPPGWIGVYAAEEDGSPIPGDIVGVTGRYDEETAQADATFIAHSRQDLEDALALLERCEAVLRSIPFDLGGPIADLLTDLGESDG